MAGVAFRWVRWPLIHIGKHPLLTLAQAMLPPTALALLARYTSHWLLFHNAITIATGLAYWQADPSFGSVGQVLVSLACFPQCNLLNLMPLITVESWPFLSMLGASYEFMTSIWSRAWSFTELPFLLAGLDAKNWYGVDPIDNVGFTCCQILNCGFSYVLLIVLWCLSIAGDCPMWTVDVVHTYRLWDNSHLEE